MDANYTVYLAMLSDEQLGLFWLIASPRARQWITGELIRRAADRGELPLAQAITDAPPLRDSAAAA